MRAAWAGPPIPKRARPSVRRRACPPENFECFYPPDFNVSIDALMESVSSASDAQPQKAPTMKDVADRVGCSPQTVHRALYAPNAVTAETRVKVMRVIKELGYRPNRSARHLATAKSSVLGIVSFATQIYGPAHTILSIDEVSKELGLNIMLTSIPPLKSGVYDLSAERHRRAVAEIAGYAPMGMILLSPVRLYREFFEDWYHNLPMIVVGECATREFASIDHDYASATQAAVQHLVDLGHQRIACLKGPPDWTPTRFRYLGYANGLKANGLPLGPSFEGDWSPQSGYEVTKAIYRQGRPEFTALVVQNDLMAFGVLRALHELGVGVPAEMSVIGYDDMPDAEYAIPPMTTLRQDYAGIGRSAINSLMSGVTRRSQHEPVLLPCPLVVRESSGPAPKRSRKGGRVKRS